MKVTDGKVRAYLAAFDKRVDEILQAGNPSLKDTSAVRAGLEAALADVPDIPREFEYGEECPICKQPVYPEEKPFRVNFSEPPDRPNDD